MILLGAFSLMVGAGLFLATIIGGSLLLAAALINGIYDLVKHFHGAAIHR